MEERKTPRERCVELIDYYKSEHLELYAALVQFGKEMPDLPSQSLLNLFRNMTPADRERKIKRGSKKLVDFFLLEEKFRSNFQGKGIWVPDFGFSLQGEGILSYTLEEELSGVPICLTFVPSRFDEGENLGASLIYGQKEGKLDQVFDLIIEGGEIKLYPYIKSQAAQRAMEFARENFGSLKSSTTYEGIPHPQRPELERLLSFDLRN